MNRLQRMQKNLKKPTQQYIDISKHQSETIGKDCRLIYMRISFDVCCFNRPFDEKSLELI
ncbi:MAG: hypothetical protein BAJALOKI2v1_90057 [Promethearchaeota archaeon]|nr:MAG: hypothetical protein BAJALOKI2v1_90057 [Candidatus Lokiarchaeota archaeon]